MKTMAKDFKMTELGPIPKDWEVKRLGVVADLLNGYAFKSEEYVKGGKYRVVTIANVQDGAFDLVNANAVSDLPADIQSHQVLVRGDVLISMTGNVGRCCKVDDDGCLLNQRVGKFRTKDVDEDFFLCLVGDRRFLGERIEKGQGGAQPNISKTDIESYLAAIPPLPEQRKIAAALSDVDEMIAALEKLIEKKRKIKTGTMQRLLTATTRLPGFKGAWVEKRLGDFATIARGGSPRPIEAFLTSDSSGVNWIKIGDVGVGAKYIERTEEKIIQEGVNHSRMVGPGDFLLSNSMSFGRPYIMKISGCIHDGWLVIQSYQQSFDTEFLYYVLGSKLVLEQYLTAAAGSSVLNLNKEVVARVIVKCPSSLAEQKAIAKVLRDMDEEIAALEAELAKTRQLKQGMMQELLTGKVRLV